MSHIDIYTDDLSEEGEGAKQFNAIEMDIFYYKDARPRGIYCRLARVDIAEGFRSFMFPDPYSFRFLLQPLARGNAKKLEAIQAAIFNGVDRDKIAESFKAKDGQTIKDYVYFSVGREIAA